MKKYKILTFFVAIIPLAIFILILMPFILNGHVKEVVNESGIKRDLSLINRVTEYEIISCDTGLKERLMALVFEEKRTSRLGYRARFFALKRGSLFNHNFNAEYIGGTTIKNATYDQILSMAKEGCSQFQESASLGLEEDSIQWMYTKAAPPKTEKELEEDRLQEKIQFGMRAAEIRRSMSSYNEEQTQYLIDLYGDWRDLNDEEIMQFNQNALNIYISLSDEEKEALDKVLDN